MTRVALIGYGEVGRILAEDLRRQGFARNNDWRVEADRILAHLKEGTRR